MAGENRKVKTVRGGFWVFSWDSILGTKVAGSVPDWSACRRQPMKWVRVWVEQINVSLSLLSLSPSLSSLLSLPFTHPLSLKISQ